MENTLREYKSPWKRFCHQQNLPHLLFCSPLFSDFPMELFGKQSPFFCNQLPVYVVFVDFYLHIPLPIVTKHELGLPFPPRNLCIKLVQIRPQFFSSRGHRQTHTQTNAGENIFPRFCGDNKKAECVSLLWMWKLFLHTEGCRTIVFPLLFM